MYTLKFTKEAFRLLKYGREKEKEERREVALLVDDIVWFRFAVRLRKKIKTTYNFFYHQLLVSLTTYC
jgi:hypothetical protein